MSSRPRIAVLPSGGLWGDTSARAVAAGGGLVVDPAEAEALVWTAPGLDPATTSSALTDVLARHPGLVWVQLPWAGVEQYARAGLLDHEHLWTCAKGAYSQPVAEHALTLTLASLRCLKAYSRAERWGGQAGRTLFGARVTIFGGGGIARELMALLGPFGCHVTVVRKRPGRVDGALPPALGVLPPASGVLMPASGVLPPASGVLPPASGVLPAASEVLPAASGAGPVRVLGWDGRHDALADADAVILALALTEENAGFFDQRCFEAMEAHACLVNVARGQHVVTDDLVAALAGGQIGAAGLDVTDPEPLPEGHRLWSLDNCLITPHTANTTAMAIPVLAARITANVRHFAAGEPLEGVVDPDLGY